MNMEDQVLNRLEDYFSRPVALRAGEPLGKKAQIELAIQSHEASTPMRYVFSREGNRNRIVPKTVNHQPDLTFGLSPQALDRILDDPSEDIGQIGVNIAKLIFSSNDDEKVSMQLHSGVLTLLKNGYFGVITSGGKSFSAFLAQRGFNGISAIRSAIGRLKRSK